MAVCAKCGSLKLSEQPCSECVSDADREAAGVKAWARLTRQYPPNPSPSSSGATSSPAEGTASDA